MEIAPVEARQNWCKIATVTSLALSEIAVLYYIAFLGFTRGSFTHWDIEIIVCCVILIILIIIVTALMSVNNAELIAKGKFFLAIWFLFGLMEIPILALLYTGYRMYAILGLAAIMLCGLIDILIIDPSNLVAPASEAHSREGSIFDEERFYKTFEFLDASMISSDSGSSSRTLTSSNQIVEESTLAEIHPLPYSDITTQSEASSSTQAPIREEQLVDVGAVTERVKALPDLDISASSEMNSSTDDIFGDSIICLLNDYSYKRDEFINSAT